MSFCDLRTNRGFRRRALDRQWPVNGPVVRRGAELGTFHMGSSVVLAGPADRIRLEVAEGTSVRVGAVLGQVIGEGAGA